MPQLFNEAGSESREVGEALELDSREVRKLILAHGGADAVSITYKQEEEEEEEEDGGRTPVKRGVSKRARII